MNRISPAAIVKLQRHVMYQNHAGNPFFPGNPVVTNKVPCDVFINHRGIDTKPLAGLLYDNLYRLNINPFLDNKNMKPGDKLFDKIDTAIRDCKLGVAVFSPNYCKSYFCLHELALFMETKKLVIPIFCDIKPSQLRVFHNRGYNATDVRTFNRALEEAKNTVGFTFDSSKGNWSKIVTNATDIIITSLMEIEKQNEKTTTQCMDDLL